MTPDHAAALALLDRITPGPWVAEEHRAPRTTRLRVRLASGAATICQVTALIHKQENARAIAALPELAALYRAGVEMEGAVTGEAYHNALLAFYAALAAVADALTQGEGK